MNKNEIVLLDGAVGTSLWEKTENKVAVWRYNRENPAIVQELAHEYVEAGAQIVLANTFGANRIAMKNTDYTVNDIVPVGVQLAKEAVQGRAKVALSVGPLPVLLEPYGDLSEEEATEIFEEQLSAGVIQKPDIIVLQTFFDLAMMKIAVQVAAKYDLPIFSMMSFTAVGKTIMGNSVKDFVEELKELPMAAIGLNCSLGPEAAVPVIAQFRQYTELPLIFKPNAGKPILGGGETTMQFDIPTFITDSLPALEYGVTYIGGCCGCNAAYIRALHDKIFP